MSPTQASVLTSAPISSSRKVDDDAVPMWRRKLQLLLKLGRMKMTVFSAVTYGAAARLAGLSELDSALFISGWAFVFFTQMVAHFLGEYYDLHSDRLNVHAGPLTGGSKVLITGQITPRQCFSLGYGALAISTALLLGVLPQPCWPVGFVLIAIAHQYSAPPFKLNHRGLGELLASAATNIFLPVFAALVQPVVVDRGEGEGRWSMPAVVMLLRSLAVLVVPAFFLKVSLFLALNMADRRADWLGGKYTVPVLFGEEASARMLGACNILAYLSAIGIYLMGLCHATTLVAVLMTAPEGLSIALAFNPSFNPKSRGTQRPYHLEGLVLRCIKHAPGVVLAVFADIVLRELFAAGSSAATAVSEGSSGASAGVSIGVVAAWLKCVGGLLWSSSLLVSCLPLIPFVYTFLVRSPPPKPQPAVEEAAAGGYDEGVVIAGGGIGGLVLAACLQELGLPFQVLEKSPGGEVDGGADLALWPAATKILKELRMGSAESDDGGFVDVTDFWGRKTYPVHLVRMAKVVDKKQKEEPLLAASSSSPVDAAGSSGGISSVSSSMSAPEEVLTKVDMDAVVEVEGEAFQLVGREALMSSLIPLVPAKKVHRGVRVTRAEQQIFTLGEKSAAVAPAAMAYVTKSSSSLRSLNPSAEAVNEAMASKATGDAIPAEKRRCRVLVGADGIHSVCRPAVSAAAAAAAADPARGIVTHGCDGSNSSSMGAAAAAAPRYGGEVCYRGVVNLRAGSAAAELRPLFEDKERANPGSMSVVYGDRIRFSWGFLDSARETGYWFVKQLTEEGENPHGKGGERPGERWPEPLRSFARLTDESCTYAHRIQDRPPLARWSSSNITLLGDACHPATPNNGQGACMAIEDAFVLATLLAEYWDKPDGHVEAFYLYERARLAHTKGVQKESYKQMKLGQLTSAVGIWVRETAIRSIPPSVLQKKLRAANVFDVDPWLVKFRAMKTTRPKQQ